MTARASQSLLACPDRLVDIAVTGLPDWKRQPTVINYIFFSSRDHELVQ